MAVGSDEAEFAQIGAQGVAVLRCQSVVLDHVLHIVDGIIELPFLEVTLCVIPVEFGKVLLGVVVTGNFFVVLTFEVFGAA